MTKENNELRLFADALENQTDDKQEKKEVVNKTRYVFYCGRKKIIEDRTLTLEDIRADLEKDFPELRKGKTNMDYDEKTGIIVPVVKAARAGCC